MGVNRGVVLLNSLNAELNLICHLLPLLGAHHIFHVSGLRVNCNHGCRWEWVINTKPYCFTLRKGPITHCRGGFWASVSVWTDVENMQSLFSNGFRIPDCPVRRVSLHQLCYSTSPPSVYIRSLFNDDCWRFAYCAVTGQWSTDTWYKVVVCIYLYIHTVLKHNNYI